MRYGTYALPGLGAHYLLTSTYNVGRAFDDWNYWNDYYRNTGVRARYKFRSGSYDYLKFVGKVL